MIDPALEEILASAAPEEEVETLVLLRPGRELPPPARLVARFGDVVTCRLLAGDLLQVRSDPAVVSMKASRIFAAAGVTEGEGAVLSGEPPRRPPGLRSTGSKAIVACVDFGCDFAHPNFRQRDGSTRLLALWDQRRPVPGQNRYGYGRIYGREEIDQALLEPDPYTALGYHPAEAELSRSLGSHGTFVLDIAAGAGNPSGVAPGSDLLFVHLAARNAPLIGGLSDSVRVLESLDWCRSMANDQNRAWVCNCSIGRTGGEKAGRSLVDRGLEALVTEEWGPSRCVIIACGNYFHRNRHVEGWLPSQGGAELNWIVDEGDFTPNELELFYSGRDRFGVELQAPSGEIAQADLDSSADVIVDGRVVGRIYHRAFDPVNSDHHVDCFLGIAAPSGRWRLRLRGLDVVDGRYHAWIERDLSRPGAQSSFAKEQASPRSTLGSLASGFRTITVGAADGSFSSSGPTRDGRIKPDLAAPGVNILAARSTPRGALPGSGGLVRMSGTSMAAPMVAGTVALMFDVAPRPLRIEETRALLLGACRRHKGMDPLRVGAGLLDVEEAVRRAEAIGLSPIAEEDEAMKAVTELRGGGASSVEARVLRALSRDIALLPDSLYQALMAGLPALPSVKLVALPSHRLTTELQAGDVLLRIAPGEPGLGHVAVLADGDLLPLTSLAALGLAAEGGMPGYYAQVIEDGVVPHTREDRFARLVTDRRGYVPNGQMILRVDWDGKSPDAQLAGSTNGRDLRGKEAGEEAWSAVETTRESLQPIEANAVARMRAEFIANATAGSPKDCITITNSALRRLFGTHLLHPDGRPKALGSTCQDSMRVLQGYGLAQAEEVFEFNDSAGRLTRGTIRPNQLQTSVEAWLIAQAAQNNLSGWYVFGLSLMDGYHSVVLALSFSGVQNPATRIYWADQIFGGWDDVTGGLDARISSLTQRWWDALPVERKARTRATVWPLVDVPARPVAVPHLLSPVHEVELRSSSSEEVERSFIIEARDLTADQRAFAPRRLDKTGRATLAVRVPGLPLGGSIRWSVPPGQAGRYTLAGGARTQAGPRAEVTGIRPGLTAIDVEVRDASGSVIESQKFDLSIPQFVTVDLDPSFTALMSGFGLIDLEVQEILRAARDTCDVVLSSANVRTIWLMPPFGEALPPQFAPGGPGPGMVTRATFRGDPPAPALYGRTNAGVGGIGPADFEETIDVFAGAFDDAVAGHMNQEVDEVTNQVIGTFVSFAFASSGEKSLAFQVYGRVLGETLAHEIGHSLIGATLSDGFHNASPGFPDDLMNHGIDRSFQSRSGFELVGRLGAQPLADTLRDRGISFVDIPANDGQKQLNSHFPVPPGFK